MIDPTNVTNYNRTKHELEEFFLFSVFVAGKVAKVTARSLSAFLEPAKLSPLNYVRFLVQNGDLESELRRARLGQYARLVKLLTALVDRELDISSCSIKDLENIPGIGPKTSRFFILHTRSNQRYAVLDVHIMRWLREEGYDAPTRPKDSEEYAFWEEIFLNHSTNYIREFENITVADFDLLVWVYGVSKREKKFSGSFREYLEYVKQHGINDTSIGGAHLNERV